MKQLLYIGKETEVQNTLENLPGVQFTQVQNVVGLHNLLQQSTPMDLIIADEHLKGLDGFGIYQRYRKDFEKMRAPFCLYIPHPDRRKRRTLLKAGVSEIFTDNHGLNNGELEDRITFLQGILQSRLEAKPKVLTKNYRIPLSKRVFDIVVAGLALIILSPLLLVTIIAIRLESKGPIFYVSKRVGTGYKVFDFYKFRSMYVDADKRVAEMKHLSQYAAAANKNEQEDEADRELLSGRRHSPTLIHKDGRPMSEEEYLKYKRRQQAGTFVKFKNDPRVTRVGNFIRNTSIDELPQLFNVLKGDMSIVGNRPLPLYEAEQLTSDDWGERFLAPAGITGLWQVMKRGKGEMSEEERKALDNQYARKVSLYNDIKLIIRTIPALFQKENV